MTRFSFAVAAALSLAFAQFAVAATVPFVPAKDNTLIQRTDPLGQLSNGLGDVFVGRTNQDGQGPATISIRRGLLEFDLSQPSTVNGQSIPAGAIITGVKLTMRDVMGLNGDPVVALHRTLNEWGEGTSFQSGGMGAAATDNDATWLYTFYNAAAPGSSSAWTTPGGDFDAAVSAAAIVSDDLGGGQLFVWSSVGHPLMIADVQSWLDAPAGNHGWTLTGDESAGQTAKRLNGGESTTAPNVAALLEVTYEIPEPTSALLAALAVCGLMCSRRTPLMAIGQTR